MQKSDMVELLTVFYAQWGYVAVTPIMVDLWLACLPKVSKQELFVVMQRILKLHDRNGPPSIADVNRELDELRTGQTKTNDEVWGLLLELVSRFGTYQEKLALDYCETKDANLCQIIKRFGWRNICAWDVGDHGMHRAQIWKVYQSLDSRGRVERIAPMREDVERLVHATAQQISMNKYL
jgi:hypothetical protein